MGKRKTMKNQRPVSNVFRPVLREKVTKSLFLNLADTEETGTKFTFADQKS